jgi:hypothetical protein
MHAIRRVCALVLFVGVALHYSRSVQAERDCLSAEEECEYYFNGTFEYTGEFEFTFDHVYAWGRCPTGPNGFEWCLYC